MKSVLGFLLLNLVGQVYFLVFQETKPAQKTIYLTLIAWVT